MTINKRKMKKLLTIAFAAALTVGVAAAQENKEENAYPAAKQITENTVKRLTEMLTLTKAQQDSIGKYVLISTKQETDILEAQGVALKTKREQQEANLSARTAKIKSFLTKEQIEKWAAISKAKEEEEEN